ncbi:hypothetical protein A2U01_0024842 [Trifolium medium]|uniref:Uncharacterized protein n=1 Tax=Trifolium medium TaxID=97028 RepID=A0A392NVF2_9FABA|nr:hypothetical protein [Trifolium medium]
MRRVPRSAAMNLKSRRRRRYSVKHRCEDLLCDERTSMMGGVCVAGERAANGNGTRLSGRG